MTKDRLPIDGKIAQANGRLKAGRVSCRIERLGNFLYLRATLPPKPGSSKTEPHQQRLSTGYSANGPGLSLAEAEAKTVAGLLQARRFSWEPYLRKQRSEVKTIGEWVELLERDYFTRRDRNPKSQLTWDKDYSDSFKKLPSNSALTVERILATVEASKPDSRTRKRLCMAFGVLAQFAGLEIDLKPLRGKYSPSAVEPQELPSDELIAEWYHRIPTASWQLAYALMAAYGIRPSEVTYCLFDDLPILSVSEDGKTGWRRVWPYYPEWGKWVQMGVKCTQLPKITGKDAAVLGHRVNHQLTRYGVPFPPKMLRHAWAARTIAFGLDTSEAARQMGHSEAVHCNIYHRWLDDRHHQRTFDRVMANPNRPKAPTGV